VGREASKRAIFMDNAAIHNKNMIKEFMVEGGLASISTLPTAISKIPSK
jgi:hypothetical protein